MKEKEQYVAPTIAVVEVEMENSIASGSAITEPGGGSTGDVEHQWDEKDDVEREFEW